MEKYKITKCIEEDVLNSKSGVYYLLNENGEYKKNIKIIFKEKGMKSFDLKDEQLIENYIFIIENVLKNYYLYNWWLIPNKYNKYKSLLEEE